MKRPEVTLQNYEAVYDFYQTHDVNDPIVQLGVLVMDKIFKPDVHFAPGADEAITKGFAAGNVAILASNHVNEFDQYHIAALPRQQPAFESLYGGVVIPSKPSLFPGGRRYPLRWIVDELASVPAFRTKDQSRDGQPLDEQTKAMQRAAKARLISLVGHKQADGYHLMIFPEGERNTVDPRKVQPVKPGLGEMYFASPASVGKMVVPMAMYYGKGKGFRHGRKPTVFVGEPLINEFDSPQEVTAVMQVALQECLEEAIDIREARTKA